MSGYDETLTLQLFTRPELRRHMEGACLFEDPGQRARFLNITNRGILHYRAGLEMGSYLPRGLASGPISTAGNKDMYLFWSCPQHIWSALRWASKFYADVSYRGELKIEAKLSNLANREFSFAIAKFAAPFLVTIPFSSAEIVIPAERLDMQAQETLQQLIYQLKWPLGTDEPSSLEDVSAKLTMLTSRV